MKTHSPLLYDTKHSTGIKFYQKATSHGAKQFRYAVS